MIHCDLSQIKNITPGSLAFPIQILSLFLDDTPSTFQKAFDAEKNGDIDTAFASIHKIKPSILMLGISPNFTALFLDLNENLKHKQNLDKVSSQFDELAGLFIELYKVLENELQEMKNQ
jgi:hypothetical protein